MKLTAEATIFDDQRVSEDIVYLSDGIDETNVRVDATNTRVDAVNDDIYEINGNISQINDDIGTLEDDMAGIEDEIDDLGQAIGDVSGVAADALNSATKIFGTCATQAQVAAKEVTCSGFKLFTGATINVLFTNSNTSANATLNVNNTGAKPIKVFGASTTDSGYTAGINWATGELVTFTYDGTNWQMQSSGTNFSGVCDTAAGTAAKVVTCKGFVLHTGAMIAVRFNETNSVANPTLNVNGTGAKAINANGSNLSANSPYNWSAGDTVIFTYNGTNWVMDKSLVAAVNAQTSANSKNKVFYQETAPQSSVGLKVGDTWFELESITEPGAQTAHDAVKSIQTWNGTAWVEQPLSNDALDVFTVAKAIIAYLDVYSLTADQITALFGTFKGIRSQAKISGTNEPVSSWDLDSGEFKTVNGEFTGKIESSQFITDPVRTRKIEVDVVDGSFDHTGYEPSNKMSYIQVDSDGIMGMGRSPYGYVILNSKIEAAYFDITNGTNETTGYGWFASDMFAAERMFVSTGEVLGSAAVASMIDNEVYDTRSSYTGYNGSSDISGVSGIICGRIATLFIGGLTYNPSNGPINSINNNTYRLNSRYWPAKRIDALSTNNSVRFYIYSDTDTSVMIGQISYNLCGYIRPATEPTSNLPLRGTVTYIRAYNN